MKTDAIKVDLHAKIDHADPRQLADIYELITNYFNEETPENGWDNLSAPMQGKLTKSMEEANNGLVTPAIEVIKNMREKYSLHG